jgi:large subunit ribosomal protein L3
MPFIIGRKLEMSQQFKEDGTIVPVTLVKAEPNVVTQIRTPEKDGYAAVQVAADKKKEEYKTHREFRVIPGDTQVGATLDVSAFTPGMHVDVTGFSKGRGFQGVVKRHHFAGGPATHGQKDQMRMPGSLASQRQGPVSKGQRMAGHMGDERVTVKNLEIVSVDASTNTIAIRGAVPGARNGLLLIQSREAKTVWQK